MDRSTHTVSVTLSCSGTTSVVNVLNPNHVCVAYRINPNADRVYLYVDPLSPDPILELLVIFFLF